jgi:hypothetical protein
MISTAAGQGRFARTMQVSQWAYGMLEKEKPVYVSRIGLDEALHHPLTV